MTLIAPNAAASGWMSRSDLAQASGLREDLVTRFIPGTDTPAGTVYPAHQVALAVYVKELTDHNLPPAAVDEKVREFLARPSAPTPAPIVGGPTVSRRTLWTAVGGAAATSLILGGVLGGLIGSSDNPGNKLASAAPTVTVEVSTPQVNPTIPAMPDPVCAEWGPISNSYAAKQSEWGKTDAKIPASSWDAEQRALWMEVIPVLRAQAAEIKRLADGAKDPFLARLMREQAMYEEEFASRIPNYEPSDQALWQAAIDYGSAVRATCLTVRPR